MPSNIHHRISGLFGKSHSKYIRRSSRPIEVHYAENLEDRRMLSATELVTDINQQAPTISYREGVEIGGVFFFSGFSNASSRNGLWKYDPEANGGKGEATFLAGSDLDFHSPFGLTEVDGKLVFGANVEDGYALWQWDPNAISAESQLIQIAKPEDGPASSHFDMLELEGELFYRGIDENHNFELWRYTPGEGISKVATVENNLIGASFDLVAVNSRVYFHLRGENAKFQLWEYDSALEGSVALRLVTDQLTYGETRLPELASVAGKVYFPADDEVNGVELWGFDALANDELGELKLVANLLGREEAGPRNFAEYRGRLYFQTWRTKIFELDPSGIGEFGTVREIIPVDGIQFSNSVSHLQSEGDNLYLWATTLEYKTALWQLSPAIENGSDEFSFVVDVKVGAGPEFTADVAALGDLLMLSVPSGFNDALWVYDPLGNQGAGSAGPVREFVSGSDTSQAYGLVVLDGKLYFGADDGVNGIELWVHDPQANSGEGSTRIVQDIFPGIGNSIPRNLMVIDGCLYFSADDLEGEAIWRYQPESDELDRLADIVTSEFHPGWAVLGRRLYFSAYSPGGFELQYYDLDVPPGTGSVELATDMSSDFEGSPYKVTAVGDKIYFLSNVGELWQFTPSANSANGEAKRIDIDAYGLNSIRAMMHMNGRLYFRGHSWEHGVELWEYEPIATEDTGAFRRLSDINSGSAGSFPEQLTALNGKLYFIADDGTSGVKLWSFDPTAADGQGDVSLEAIWEGYSFRSSIYSLIETPLPTDGENVFVEVYGPSSGWSEEVWAFNTNRNVRSSNPFKIPGGAADLGASGVEDVTPLGGRLYFVANYQPIGHELFAIDVPLGNTLVDFSFSTGTVDLPGTIVNEILPGTITEWEDAIGQLWLNLGEDASELPFDLTIQIDLSDSWFDSPSVTSCLGTDTEEGIDQANGQWIYTLTIFDVDLSSYELGDRVLVASIEFPLDPNNTTGVEVDGDGSYPEPTTEHGVSIYSAVNASTSEPLEYSSEVYGQFTPMIYDTNDDGRVGLADFAEFIASYGRTADAKFPKAYRFDFNKDGKVGLADFALFISHYGDRKFPLATQFSQTAAIEGEPLGESTAATSYRPTATEHEASIYWEASEQSTDVCLVTESINDDEDESVLPLATPFEVTDPSWDAQIIDAALRSNDWERVISEDDELELEATISDSI